jgi:hypothetical protein
VHVSAAHHLRGRAGLEKQKLPAAARVCAERTLRLRDFLNVERESW